MHRLPHSPAHPARDRGRRSAAAALAFGTLGVILAACAASPQTITDPASTRPAHGHGYVEGASELSEPQLHLATADRDGGVELTDLLSGERGTVAQLGPLSALTGDGRFVAAHSAPAGVVTIIDTGVWTVDHEDHQHYYRADARVVGEVRGDGPAVVVTGSTTTAVRFAGNGESVLLDTEALGSGTVTETGRITTGRGPTGITVPVGDTVVATRVDGTLGLYGSDGSAVDTTSDAVTRRMLDGCTAPAGTITTNVGVVIGCAEGALLAIVDHSAGGTDPVPSFEAIPYPHAVVAADRAASFHARPGRPTVAAVAGTSGAWLLDTRERTWSLVTTPVPLQTVTAIDDRDEHVVALTTDGALIVLDGATGAITGTTSPLVSAADLAAGVQLEVDQNRAYLNTPSARTVSEVDFADAARIARTFTFETEPAFLAETGR